MALDHALAVSKSDPSVVRIDNTRYTAPTSYETTGLTPSSCSPSSSSPGPYLESPTPLDPSSALPSTSPAPGSTGSAQSDSDTLATNPSPGLPDVDPQILEALRGKDRIYVLKLGEAFETLIKEHRPRCDLTPATSYQRLLVHRCSAYYKLVPESDPVTKAISVCITHESRIPERRICELVPAESPTQPAFKIMRRSVPERRSKPQSHAGSVAGEDADLSDVEPSEAGSLGGRSNATNNSGSKKRMTIEEREAAYNEARSRIFMDFEEKEKNKEKDMSASSSSLSISGSTSTSAGGRSSLGDTDDAISSPATESEWSTPSGSNSRRDPRRGGHHNGSGSSSRSLRSGGSFHANGSGGSSRNSRAPSPSFTYASLYEPPPSGGQIYDPSQHHPPNLGYHPNQFTYPYPPPNHGPTPPFLPSYPYYPQQYNPYQPPPMPQQDPTTPPGPEQQPYSPQHQMNYGPPYGWPHPNQPPLQSPPHPMHAPLPQQPQQNPPPPPPPHSMGPMPPHPPPPHSPPYPPYNMHPPHAYSYPMGAYYPPPPPPGQPQQMPPPPPGPPAHPQANMQQQQQYPGYDVPRSMNMNGTPMHPPPGPGPPPPEGHFNSRNGNNLNNSHQNNSQNNHQNNQHLGGNAPRHNLGNGVIPPISNGGRGPQRNGSGFGGANHGNNNNNANGVNGNGKHRGPAPPPARSAWTYGPGVGMGGFPANFGNNSGSNVNVNGGSGGEAVGPRFNHSNSNRRTSGHGSSGGNSRASSNCDEVSSVASSSTTSSSSRRTYTSTTSSQHPLPARPDWAVGMKAQPTLAATGPGRQGPGHHDQQHGLFNSSSTPNSSGNSRTMSPISPPRSNSGSNLLQATDFPPLNPAGPAQERARAPVVTGAWSSARPVLSLTGNANPNNTNTNANTSAPGSAPVSALNSPNPNVQQIVGANARQEDSERPAGKTGELYNPKVIKRPGPPLVNGTSQARAGPSSPAQANMKDDPLSAHALAGQVASMSLEEDSAGDATISLPLSLPSSSNQAATAPPPASI